MGYLFERQSSRIFNDLGFRENIVPRPKTKIHKFTVRLDQESYVFLEEDRGELSQSDYIEKLLKEYRLKVVLKKRRIRPSS